MVWHVIYLDHFPCEPEMNLYSAVIPIFYMLNKFYLVALSFTNSGLLNYQAMHVGLSVSFYFCQCLFHVF